MRLKHITQVIGIAALLSVAGGCSKFVDINSDPNNPTTAQLSLLLPATEISLVGNMYALNSGTATFVQHTIFTNGLSRYQQQGTSFDDPWSGFYTQTLNDLQSIITSGTAQDQWGYVGIARLEKAYLVTLMVDMWGDIPYSEGTEEGPVNVSPPFLKGADIYEKCLVLIDSALANLNSVAGTSLVPATADPIYAGSKVAWISMGKSLQLKLYNGIRLVDPVRSANAIKALLTDPSKLISSNTSDFTFKFGTVQNPNNRHPWHRSEYQGGKSFYMSQSLIDLLFNNDDPRLRYYISRQNTTAGLNNSNNSNGYYGRNPGDGTASPADQSRRSSFGIYPAGGRFDNAAINNLPPTNLYLTNTGATGTAKVLAVTDGTGAGIMPMITYAMVKFIRAEAALTLATGDDARTSFRDGIIAHLSSMSTYAAANGGNALAQTVIDAFAARLVAQYDAADNAGKLNLVMTQKYIAQYGNGMETYSDYRRTGLPVLRAPLSPLNTFPLRLYYSEAELTANTNLGAEPGQLQLAQQTTPVFWDK